MELIINGRARELEGLREGSTVADLIVVLGMQADRVALERNGEIVSRESWAGTPVQAGDRLEIVHFVGGGVSRNQSCSGCEGLGLKKQGTSLEKRQIQ